MRIAPRSVRRGGTASPGARHALLAASLGYVLDSFDVLLDALVPASLMLG
ncbi:MAG: hypothetical protein HYX76_01585 [Acidobacteria bacterium]|nr:hypothetical protein [Acidobacteriota bacterium]